MRVLLTGGCGFIGVNLCHLLVERGDSPLVVDDFSLGRAEALSHLPVEVHRGDVRRPQAWSHLLQGVDGVVHLAAATGIQESIADPRHDFEVNALGTFNVLAACREAGVRRVVFASTNALLGRQPPPMTERVVPAPLVPYAASKLAGEGYCSAFRESYGLATTVLRFANVYGPHSSHKGSVVACFVKAALAGEVLTVFGDGRQTRDFVHVMDVARAIVGALSSPGAEGVYQIGAGRGIPVLELAEIVARLADVPIEHAPRRPNEVPHSFTDIGRAQSDLGYRPQVDLARGVTDVYRWFAAGSPDDWPAL